MRLPIRLSSAQLLLDEYEPIVFLRQDSEEAAKQELLDRLEDLYTKCSIICTKMLNALGYTGNLASMEQLLSNKIQSLQKSTYFLNGEALNDFILKDFSEIIPFDPRFQDFYNFYLQQLCHESIDKESPNIIANITRIVNEDFGHILGNQKIVVDSNGTGRASTGRDIMGRFAAKINKDFYITGEHIQKAIKQLFGEEKSKDPELFISKAMTLSFKKYSKKNIVTIDVSGTFSHEKILSILKARNSDLIQLPQYEELLKKVNEHMIKYIISQSSVTEPKVLEDSIRQILNEKPSAFIVGNTQRNLTGILGEIQGLYFIKTILNTNNKNIDTSVLWRGGMGNPHADLILKTIGEQYYGIQVKNTSRNEAKQEVIFENFKGKIQDSLANGNINIEWFKESSDKYGETLAQDPELFNAATSLMGMESFNVPYVWKNGSASQANLSDVEQFIETRHRIERAAKQARNAMMTFVAGMMYMQIKESTNIRSAESTNSLYLIGGTLAITSATILREIIDNLENEIRSFNLSFQLIKTINKSESRPYTIVDFFNSPEHHHLENVKTILQSSYNFLK